MYTAISASANLFSEEVITDYSFKMMSQRLVRIDYVVKLIAELIKSKPPIFSCRTMEVSFLICNQIM